MKIHIVQKGDTLWKIAQKYGVDFEELKKMNAQLSNPEMVMPGMKIKVPVGNVAPKKEMPQVPHGVHKEMPKMEHPFVQHKEVPKQVVKPPKEIKKEIPKEHPHTIYQPVMPQMPQAQALSEIDINNYYMMNMSQLQAQVQQPLAQQPIVKHEKEEESPVMPEMPNQDYCYPMPPVMPTCDPCYPYHQPQHMHPQQWMPQPQVQGMMMHPHQWMPQPQVQGMMMQPQQWMPQPQMQGMMMHPQQWMPQPQVQGTMMQPQQGMHPQQQQPAGLPGMADMHYPETGQHWDDESSNYPQMGMNQYPAHGKVQPASYGPMPGYAPSQQPGGYPMPPAHGDCGCGPQPYSNAGHHMPMPRQMYPPYSYGPVMPEGAGTYAIPATDDYEEDDE
ncbi:SafA/ExsA family spore coat assembly protein [Bacillus sp. FSL K6-3431]|uniref:SafA/ExsA family spore coat assembly protein n=1 Tax=Bacillus sp. FSL K6-3431 TaxID=2921500 RepID=UPI0030F8B3A7